MSSFLSSTTRAKQSLKAFVMGPKVQPDSDDITPLDCIFSCSVCGDVFSDVYQQRESVHGLSDGINTKERIVTRLYIASCCHVICIKHIGGGSGEYPPIVQFETPTDTCVHRTRVLSSRAAAGRAMSSVYEGEGRQRRKAIVLFAWLQRRRA